MPLIIENKKRDDLFNFLKSKGIETRKGFYSADRLKIFNKDTNQSLINSNYLSKNIICLPFYIGITKKQILYICRWVNYFINQ